MLTREQLILRRQGLGGSDMSALSGLSKRWRPIDVYVSKCRDAAPLSEDDPPEAEGADVDMQRGIYLEPAIRQWYAARQAAWVEEPGTLLHPEHPLVLATPDGLSHFANGQPDRALEIKCPRSNKARDWLTDGAREPRLPDYYVPQVLWEMSVLGVSHADVAVYLYDEMHVISVPFDAELYNSLRNLGEAFWQNCVVPNRPPPVDDSPSYERYLGNVHGQVKNAVMREPTDDVLDMAKKLKEVTEVIDGLKAQQTSLKSHLKSYIADAQGINFGMGAKITWRNTSPRDSVDYKALLEHCKIDTKIIEKFTTTKPGARRFVPDLTNL